MKIVNKVVTYITQADHLLVFRHPQAPEAGIQVPAGTLEAGEPPADGALREAIEETGLSGLRLLAPLGETEVDLRQYGVDAIHHRHFFHLECVQETPATWQHQDSFPADGDVLPLFEFYWARMPGEVPELAAEFGARLPELYRRIGLGQAR